MLKAVPLTFLLALCAMSDASAQSISQIGTFLEPWGTFGSSVHIAMTPSGIVVFVEEPGTTQCDGIVTQRISIIGADGTAYRVVLDSPDLFALPGPVKWTGVQGLRVAGDGGTIWFTALEDINGSCASVPPLHDFLADVETGSASHFTFNGADVGFISFTDDGQKMAFKGFDPVEGTWGFYLADVDGSNASKFLDTTPWLSTPGVLSGDGSKFLFIGDHSGFPFPSDVYLYDFSTESTLKLSPASLNGIAGASLSADGSRVIYHQWGGPMYAVQGDGTNHHVLTNMGGAGTGTITSDGEWVFVAWPNAMGDNVTYRINWDGTGVEEVAPQINFGTTMAHQPVNADGSIFGFYDVPSVAGSPGPLAVSLLSPPALTTYGFGNPGSALTWDVAGQPGDGYVLAFSLNALDPGAGTQYGLLELDPASLFVLAAGMIAATDSLGSVQVTVPPSLNLPSPIPIHFQALVQPRTGGGQLTNRTTMIVQDAGVPLNASARASGPGLPTATEARPVPGNGLSDSLTPEERMRQVALQDPSVAAWWFKDN